MLGESGGGVSCLETSCVRLRGTACLEKKKLAAANFKSCFGAYACEFKLNCAELLSSSRLQVSYCPSVPSVQNNQDNSRGSSLASNILGYSYIYVVECS